tara:strand:- start:114 stop:380 length:267 start_codon:yes stop_codon:yes gene_type:complete
MKFCRENIEKLKTICSSLDDRDIQLKTNSLTLWVVLDEIQQIKDVLNRYCEDFPKNDGLSKVAGVTERIGEIMTIVNDNNCKKVKSHE